jgi:hypothetical protein
MVGPDAEACQSSCAAPAELYVYRNPGQEIEQAVSLSGSAYMDLPVALRYRKEYVKGCSCKQAEYNPTEIMAANKQAGIDTGPMPPARATAVAGGEAAAPVEITGATPPTDQAAAPPTDQAAPPPVDAAAPPAPPPDAVAVEQAPPAPKPTTVPQKPPAPPRAAAPRPPPSDAAEAVPAPPPVAPKPSRTPPSPKASPFGQY